MLHFGLDPEKLNDEEWVLRVKQLEWLMKNDQIPGITWNTE